MSTGPPALQSIWTSMEVICDLRKVVTQVQSISRASFCKGPMASPANGMVGKHVDGTGPELLPATEKPRKAIMPPGCLLLVGTEKQKKKNQTGFCCHGQMRRQEFLVKKKPQSTDCRTPFRLWGLAELPARVACSRAYP